MVGRAVRRAPRANLLNTKKHMKRSHLFGAGPFFGQELDLELSAESATGFKGVRKVRANKDGARYQAKVYVACVAGVRRGLA